jgi:hypothetical protein
MSWSPTSAPTRDFTASTNGAASAWHRFEYPLLKWTNVTPDSSFAARHTSTTSSTDLSAISFTPTFAPVVQKRQWSEGSEYQKRQEFEM